MRRALRELLRCAQDFGSVLRRLLNASTSVSLKAGSAGLEKMVIRWEYHIENFFGMVQLACIKILMRLL